MYFLPLTSFFLVNYHKISAPKTKKQFCCTFPVFVGKIFVIVEKTTFWGKKNGHISTHF